MMKRCEPFWLPNDRSVNDMIFEIVDSTSGPLETHASKNTKFSPLRGLSPFLPQQAGGYPGAVFYEPGMKMSGSSQDESE
jgi:hypothetical protein